MVLRPSASESPEALIKSTEVLVQTSKFLPTFSDPQHYCD